MISIVTITFNNYDELIDTLSSIENVLNIESIVINGGTCEKTKEFLKNYHGISLSEPDRGISDAFNKGIQLSTGDAIMFLNSGDRLIDATYLDEVNCNLKEHPEIDFYYSDITYEDSMLGPTVIHAGEKERNLARGMPYPHQTLIVSKNVFNKVGGFDLDLKIAMDFDLILRMYKLGFTKKLYISRSSVYMDGSGISSKQELNCIKEIRFVLEKHGMLTTTRRVRLNISLILYNLKRNGSIKLVSKKFRHRHNF